jgi:hypothetical protein
MVNIDARSVDSFVLDRSGGVQTACGASRPIGVAVDVSDLRHGRGDQEPGARWKARQDGVHPQKHATNYPVTLGWAGLLLCIGVGAWEVCLAIHDARAAQQAPHAAAIYYCSTGVEMPIFEPCKEMKDQKNI